MILKIHSKSAITRTKGGIKAFLKGLPVRLSLNPYIGCSHCCVYCYNKFLIRFRKEYKTLEDICNVIIVKENLPEILEKEIKRAERSVLWIGSVSDPYQPIEKKYEITRKCLEILVGENFPFSIYTKSNLIIRDLDLINGALSEVIFTITSLDKGFKRIFEPRSPNYDKVLEALEETSKVTDTRIAILPIIPSFNDNIEMLKELIKEVKYRGAKNIFIGFLRLTPLVIKNMRKKLGEKFNEIWKYYGEKFAGAIIPKEEYRKKILKELFKFSKEIDVGFYVEDPLFFYNKKETRIDKFYYATYQDFLFYYKKFGNIVNAYEEIKRRFLVDISISYLNRLENKIFKATT